MLPIGVQLYSLRELAQKDFVAVLKKVADIGYKLVEPAGFWDIKPTDFNPILNYIGRSQYPADPLFKGHLRQVVISNYALTPEEVKNEATAIKDIRCEDAAERDNAHDAYLLNGIRATDKTRGIVIQGGRKMKISR